MSLFALLLSVVTSVSAQAPAAGLTRIGAAAAVKGVVKAQAPGAVGRVLGSGKPVFLNDHVTTDAAGRLQIMLLDETVFTIGPNSDMVLDEFVYDPATSAGKVTAQVTKGVFRFVTGKVARKDPGSMKVKLPVGTMGIRGTIAGGQTSEAGSTVILFGPGAQNNANENPGSVAVGNAGSEVVISQPGYGTTILPGQPPSGVTDMSQQAQDIGNALGEPAPQEGSSSGAGGGSASQQAGQDTAAGGASASIAGDLGSFTGTLDTTQNTASQQAAASGIADGLSTWDDVRTLLAGKAQYAGSGTYLCAAGGSCNEGMEGSGAMEFYFVVDFAGRTYGGDGSNIKLNGSQLGLPETVDTSISPASFAALSGSAVVTLSGGNHSNSDFNDTTLALRNLGGEAARSVLVDVRYSEIEGNTATGTMSAPQAAFDPCYFGCIEP
jgi:hypothetical protein